MTRVVFRIIRRDVLVLIEVPVETGMLKNDLVELQLSCGDSGTRLDVDLPDENTQCPRNHDETKAGDQELQNSEKDRCGLIRVHRWDSFSSWIIASFGKFAAGV